MSALLALAEDALRDAARRRSLLAAAVASGVAALAVDRCSGCQADLTLQGQPVAEAQLAAMTALASFTLVAVWTYALAALLASDTLATALEDGTAASVMARPVSRDVLCLARLAGALLAACGLGIALLALATALLYFRVGMPLGPAAASTLAVVAGTWSAGALAMTLSLVLPRPATLLAMTVLGGAVCTAELAHALSGEIGGLWGLLGRLGPGWISGPVAPLLAWLQPGETSALPPYGLLRSLAWGAAASTALCLAFRRQEIGR